MFGCQVFDWGLDFLMNGITTMSFQPWKHLGCVFPVLSFLALCRLEITGSFLKKHEEATCNMWPSRSSSDFRTGRIGHWAWKWSGHKSLRHGFCCKLSPAFGFVPCLGHYVCKAEGQVEDSGLTGATVLLHVLCQPGLALSWVQEKSQLHHD